MVVQEQEGATTFRVKGDRGDLDHGKAAKEDDNGFDVYRSERLRGCKQCLPEQGEQQRWRVEDSVVMGHLFGFKIWVKVSKRSEVLREKVGDEKEAIKTGFLGYVS